MRTPERYGRQLAILERTVSGTGGETEEFANETGPDMKIEKSHYVKRSKMGSGLPAELTNKGTTVTNIAHINQRGGTAGVVKRRVEVKKVGTGKISRGKLVGPYYEVARKRDTALAWEGQNLHKLVIE